MMTELLFLKFSTHHFNGKIPSFFASFTCAVLALAISATASCGTSGTWAWNCEKQERYETFSWSRVKMSYLVLKCPIYSVVARHILFWKVQKNVLENPRKYIKMIWKILKNILKHPQKCWKNVEKYWKKFQLVWFQNIVPKCEKMKWSTKVL